MDVSRHLQKIDTNFGTSQEYSYSELQHVAFYLHSTQNGGDDCVNLRTRERSF